MDERIRVALDARATQFPRPGGVGRQVANLTRELASRCDLELLFDDRLPIPGPAPGEVGVARHRAVRAPLPGFTAWLQLAVPRALDHDLFHGPFYALPFRQPVPMVVTLHDISFELFPADFTPGKLLAFRLQARHAARTARQIVTVSNAVREQIIDAYQVPSERVEVVPNAIDPVFRQSPSIAELDELLESLGARRPYVASLGGARRRRLQVALDAWRLARRELPDIQHVTVDAGELPSEPGLVAAPPLDDRSWAALLAGAEAFIYPTRHEGFGLPALEAIASGTPVVCSSLPPLREVLGDAAAFCDDDSAEGFAGVLVGLLGDKDRHRRLVRQGRARAEEAPTWADAADAYVRVYRQAVEEEWARR